MSDQIKQTKKATQIKYEVCDHPINNKQQQRRGIAGWLEQIELLTTAGPASRQKAAPHESRLLRQSTCLHHTRFDKVP